MRFERLRTADDPRFAEAMELYGISFPHHEQRNAASQRAIMGHTEYQFNLIYDEEVFVGALLCWETEVYIYVEHFCICPELRGCCYGQRALELLAERGKLIILEIDPPVDAVALRRKRFYERAGYVGNGFVHVHPPYHADCDGHSLVVMSNPRELKGEEYNAFNTYLQDVVMGQ